MPTLNNKFHITILLKEHTEDANVKYEAVVPYIKESKSHSNSKVETPLMTRKELMRPFDSDSDEENKKSHVEANKPDDVGAIKSLKE